jgi:hypothetical protein
MQTKRTRHDTTLSSVTFRFNTSEEIVSETLYSHVQRLKTKLTTHEKIWNGKILVRPSTAMNFCIYDILKQETIKTVSLDFEAHNKVFPVHGGYAVANIQQDELYFIDAGLDSCRRVFVSSKKTVVRFGLAFENTPIKLFLRFSSSSLLTKSFLKKTNRQSTKYFYCCSKLLCGRSEKFLCLSNQSILHLDH